MAANARARAIAVAQSVPVRGDVAANLEQHRELVRVAAEERAAVLLFPELSLTGYELDLAPGLAFSEHDARLEPLVELASSCDMTLVVGAPVRSQHRLHIGAFILSPDRSRTIYTKQHLGAFPASANPGGSVPPAEGSVFEAGDRNPLFDVNGSPAAVAVCADANRAAHPQQAANRGAKSYLASMFVIPSEIEADTARLRGYALAHAFSVIFSNYGGPTGGLPAAGRSAIWSERAELVVQLAEAGAGVAFGWLTASGARGKAVML
jgi:predicted amidohydrolase